MSIADAAQRRTALDPMRSFCVSAPAGSGKTELLIQRYLGLLARVQSPEQVLAITFTRKAAAEMRQRVVQALLAAHSGEPCDSPHQQATRALALAALAADETGGWQLTRDVNRINIKTIDSYCGTLTRQMPVLSEFGGQAAIVDDAEGLYREAVSDLFAEVEGSAPVAADLRALLLHFDNDWRRVQDLLVAMLRRRDQWRDYVGLRHEPTQAETYLLHTVRAVISEELVQLQAKLAGHAPGLLALQQYGAANLGTDQLQVFPGSEPADLTHWRRIADLLLTKQGSWRKTVDKRAGFPADGALAKERKREFGELVSRLREQPGLEQSLAGLRSLPDLSAGGESWRLVLQLFHILPQLAAHLLLVFARRGQVDHSQVALSALQALGDDDLPTELALRLDYRIEHILVDEFQDTAINQYELVRRLTRGWGSHNETNPESPRTIMIVGDGMQSIYGFRDANVGLFLKVREEGFNGVVPEHLKLLCNFRSEEGVVDWVNETFVYAFPRADDMRRGQVKFTAAVPVKPAGHPTAVECHAFSGEGGSSQEAEFVCARIEHALADDRCASIAVLGRSRGHLQPVIRALRQRNLAYSAQDLDTLGNSPAVWDLMSLCRALENPADRVAWLALLRAPWCGLDLADLHRVANWGDNGIERSIEDVLRDSRLQSSLSPDGQGRVRHLATALSQAEASRDRLALRVWLDQLWLTLGGPATLEDEEQLKDAEHFFQLLELADREGLGLDTDWLQQQVNKLKLKQEQPGARIQVMTLHKAKGLEFDWVLIPGLARLTRSDSRQLLLWDDYTTGAGQRGFLLAADDHSQDTEPTLYNYLQQRRKQKSRLEGTRLLYVGATRAVQRLVLSAGLTADDKTGDWKAPPGNSLLHPIWETFHSQMTVHDDAVPESTLAPAAAGAIRRLATLPSPGPAAPGSGAADPNIPARELNRLERHVGTVVHLALEQLSQRDKLPPAPEQPDLLRWEMDLRRLGLSGDSLDRGRILVNHSLLTTLKDEKGRWILSAEHRDARSEYALTVGTPGEHCVDLVIDRCFIDERSGERWIVDYKTSQPAEGEHLGEFLAREGLSYREQLAAYRQAMLGLGEEPVRCALYFTALGHLHELTWEGEIS